MKKIEVLVVSTVPMGSSGITSVIMNYYRAMNREDITFCFAAPSIKLSSLKNEITINGDSFIELGSRQDILKYSYKLHKFIKKNKFNVVHVHGNSSTMAIELFISFINKIKLRIAHSHNSTSKYKLLNFLLKPIFYLLYNKPLACSRESGKWLYGKKHFIVINNGIDLSKYIYSEEKRAIIREQLNIKDDDLVLIHIGFFNYQKNHEFLLGVMEHALRNKPVKMILISDGPLYANILERAAELNIKDNIFFMGRQSDIQGYLSASDIFLLPSRFEGFPLILVEAQANGIDCIVSDRITINTNISNKVKYLPIDEGYTIWSNEITKKPTDRVTNSILNQELITENGYNIALIADNLRKIYLGEYI